MCYSGYWYVEGEEVDVVAFRGLAWIVSRCFVEGSGASGSQGLPQEWPGFVRYDLVALDRLWRKT